MIEARINRKVITMKRVRVSNGAALLAVLLTATPALAADYAILPVKDNAGKVTACQAVNAPAGLSLLAAGDRVLLFAQSARFHTAATDTVKGTWSIDGATPAAFTSDGGGENMVAFDVPNTAEAVMALTTGKQLKVAAKGIEASYDLAGTAEAFQGLLGCLSEAESQ